jgi:hypothetical protein
VDEDTPNGELADHLLSGSDSAGPAESRRHAYPGVRSFWHTATRWPYWPVTVVIVLAVLGVLIYLAVDIIAGFFNGIVG